MSESNVTSISMFELGKYYGLTGDRGAFNEFLEEWKKAPMIPGISLIGSFERGMVYGEALRNKIVEQKLEALKDPLLLEAA